MPKGDRYRIPNSGDRRFCGGRQKAVAAAATATTMHPHGRAAKAAAHKPSEPRELIVERFQPVQCRNYGDDGDDYDDLDYNHHDNKAESEDHNYRRRHHRSDDLSLNEDNEENEDDNDDDADSLNIHPSDTKSTSSPIHKAPVRHSASDLGAGYLPAASASSDLQIYKNRSRQRYATRTPLILSATRSPELKTENSELDLDDNKEISIQKPFSRRKKPKRYRRNIGAGAPILNRSLSTSSVFALYAARYAREKFHLALRTFKTWYHEHLTYHHLSKRMEFNQELFEQWYIGKGQPLNLRALDRFDQIVIWIAGKFR